MMRRKLIAVLGSASENCTAAQYDFALELGKALVEAGFRLLTGGYDGIMEAALKGAKNAANYHEGDTLAVIMSLNPDDANDYADIVIASGINYARNQIITASADAVVAIGGATGTLSELAFAWRLKKPIIAVVGLDGWSEKLANKKIDETRDDKILPAKSVKEVIELLHGNFGKIAEERE